MSAKRWKAEMRRSMRVLGTLLVAAGAVTLIWALLVWQWMDPFTALYTKWKQHELATQYARRAAPFRPAASGASLAAERRTIARQARAYRLRTHRGQAIGRITIPRLGLDMILVDGTDHDTLEKGPGRYLGSFMPGENRLVYVAGHRTTFLAPFSHIEDLRRGDAVTIDVPYATFTYRVSGHRIVSDNDVGVLRSPRHERLILQACHPRFLATHRYLQYAQLRRVEPKGGAPYELSAAAAQPGESRR
jgi:sortase A